ncbi:MAG: TonB-dependent receptor [Chitinophagaceae bacterium]|nr:TonB-dependent receptor [Chitinophagaceae bacterium]HQV05340.1 TonB-dependent receptor [Chitinophagaceae bacterium]
MKIYFLFFLFVYLPCCVAAQVQINGSVLDDKQSPISGANITLLKKNSKLILAYAISDRDGKFIIQYNGKLEDSLVIKAALLGYYEESIIFLPSNKTEFLFTLAPQEITLPEVKVKALPIWQRKDTLNYNVSAFKQKQDRVIGDIIARLPGIEVTPNGQIKYNGKPINKYYIEGMDLLEDRYSIANNNIPADVVDKVQVLENHQPIRLLDSISFSDRAALNIKLKDDAKIRVIGRAKIGIGMSPLLSEDALTSMLFKKKIQFINTYKYSNTGLDNSSELASHNIFDYINAIQNGALKKDLVSIVKPANPSFSSQRYLFNNSNMASINLLVPLRKDYELRINTNYINDFQQQQSNVFTRFYLPTDTVVINERNNYQLNQNKLNADFTLMANTPKVYFKNNLKFEGWWQSENGKVFNIGEINQQLNNPYFHIANDFKLLKTKSKHILEFGSYIGFVALPQNLTIEPGLYANQLNNNIAFDGLFQKAVLKTFYTDNYFSFRKMKSKFDGHYKIGFNVQNQNLETNLQTIDRGIYKSIADTFQNNLKWNRYKVYAENNWTYEGSKLRVSFSLPVKFIRIEYNDVKFKNGAEKNALFINPLLSIMYQLSLQWTINTSASIANGFGDISGISSGYILSTYRNLSNSNAPLAASKSLTLSTGVTFRNPLKVIFFNNSISYSHSTSNMLYRQTFNGSLESLVALLQNNYTNRIAMSGRVNKYIIELKTSLGFKYGYTFGNQQQIQQNNLITFSNKNYNFGITINSKLSDNFTTDYTANYFHYTSASQLQKSKSAISSANQKFSLNYFPLDKWMISIATEHYYFYSQFVSSSNYIFGDMNLRYKFKKSKIDLELTLQNIFNTKSFIVAALISNVETVSSYKLRPRQILFKLNFSF